MPEALCVVIFLIAALKSKYVIIPISQMNKWMQRDEVNFSKELSASVTYELELEP